MLLCDNYAPLVCLLVKVVRYDRLVPLQPQKYSLEGRYQAVQPGDCLVVFSRWRIFEVRDCIERMTNHRCAVIYGGLPSGLYFMLHLSTFILTQSTLSEVPYPSPTLPSSATRIQQANLFNDPRSKCNVLVATDAVGLGLNL